MKRRDYTTTQRLYTGQHARFWMVTDPATRSFLCVVDDFGNLVEVSQ